MPQLPLPLLQATQLRDPHAGKAFVSFATMLPSEGTAPTDGRLPVTLICGFLGAGKTTLLKRILEAKHSAGEFRCAVIVNDMAALNIDKSLVDQSAVVQSDEVVAMQNGCLCCTLQSDLVEQIAALAQRRAFDYMLIEASGVSEPSQIAPLFEPCVEDHDHAAVHGDAAGLGELARLDTCVTVVDAAEFHNNLHSVGVGESENFQGTVAELMMEQVEFSNVVVLNKEDLVSAEQQRGILDRISLINPRAKVLTARQGAVEVMQILDTGLFSMEGMSDSVMISAMKAEPTPEPGPPVESQNTCCEAAIASTGAPCCSRGPSSGQVVETRLSQVLPGVTPGAMPRHDARFGITSFVYRARRPFHPSRLYDELIAPYFVLHTDGGSEGECGAAERQREAAAKQARRGAVLGELLRSKGFLWLATSHNILAGWSQAGNIATVRAECPWMCNMRELWEGTPSEASVLQDMVDASTGEAFPYGDRRQELVFIGMRLHLATIQSTLDRCLLTDAEMDMGPPAWEESMAAGDPIRVSFPEEEEEEEEGAGTGA